MGEINLNATSGFKCPPKYSFTSAPHPIDKHKGLPGPGQYGLTNTEKDKFSRSPSFTICGAPSDGKDLAPIPGPGAYSPELPPYKSPKWLFSTDLSRLKANKPSGIPGPGQYNVSLKADGVYPCICSKPERKPGAETPGPGQYKPMYDALSGMGVGPKVSFGASSRKSLQMSKTPGPGQYENLSTLGGNVTMKLSPKYSIKGRYKHPDPFVTPGPGSAGTTFR